jgi:hypothetical protein
MHNVMGYGTSRSKRKCALISVARDIPGYNRWPCTQKGNKRASAIPISSQLGHYVTLRAA